MTDESAELVILKAIYNKLNEIKDIFQIKGVVSKTLADFSNVATRVSSGKPMPEQIGEYTISKKGCNRCGGKITWDNYDPTSPSGQKYPDHIDESGNIIDCPEYKY